MTSAFSSTARDVTRSVLSRVLRITRTGPGATIHWTLSSSESWLTFSRVPGTDSGDVRVWIDTSSLTPGTFGATISVWAPEALHPVQTIPVMITIAAMAD